jgi:hypothetical protein
MSAGTNNACLRGNAFALFLKSQRKWANPPLQDEHKEQFLKFCLDHEYDAAKSVFPSTVRLNLTNLSQVYPTTWLLPGELGTRRRSKGATSLRLFPR